MAILKDLSGVPAAPAPESHPPVEDPIYAPTLAAAFLDALGDTSYAKAGDTRLRNSWAGMCSRLVQYNVAGAEPTNPKSVADHWRMETGSIIHERWQQAMARFGVAGARMEPEAVVTYDDGFESSGHTDLVDGATSVELKTINGFGFKMAVGARGAAEGPKLGHRLQGALNAVGRGSERLVIVYLSLENLSPAELRKLLGREPTRADEYRRFTAEWHYGVEEFGPWAEAEKKRLTKVLEYVDRDELVPRTTPEMPKGARIVDPSKGRWDVVSEGLVMESGTTWVCDYCDQRDRCIADGQ